jgi:hypothetical protein
MLEGAPDPVRILAAADVQRHKSVFHGTDGLRVVELPDIGDIAELGNPPQQRWQGYPVPLHRYGFHRHVDLEGLRIGSRQAGSGIQVVLDDVVELRAVACHLLGDAGDWRTSGRKSSHRCTNGRPAGHIDRFGAQARQRPAET